MKKFLLLPVFLFLFLFTSCNNPSNADKFLPVQKAKVKEVDVTGMVGKFSYVSNGLLQVKNSKGYDFMCSDGKLLRGDYPFVEHGDYVGLGRFFVRESEGTGYIIDSKGKVIADNFLGRPILQVLGFRNGVLGVLVEREPNDVVLDVDEKRVRSREDGPIMYSTVPVVSNKDPGKVWGTIYADGNVLKDGDPSVLEHHLIDKNGCRFVSFANKTDVIPYFKSVEGKPYVLHYGLYDSNEDKPITEPFFLIPIFNGSSGEKSGSLAVMTEDFDFLWIDTQGNTILDIGEIFPEIKKFWRKVIASEKVEGISSFVSSDAFIMRFDKDDKAVIIGKDGKALGYLDAKDIICYQKVPGRYTAYINDEGKCGILRDDLKVVVEPSYDEITSVDKNYFVGVRGEKTFLCTIVE